ncbi:MAG: dienelactone hydrolase family protein [Alphaproteobacteria bacterium]|jgi:carboxymethylenebutenolidase|nr:dienelactone hydrolase family protein [Alphaproteobacteria bacterium]
MASRYVDIEAADGGRFSAYMTGPPGHKVPGVVVIQEIFGINSFVREFAERLASIGYLAVVPDLFWRQQPGIDITDKSEAEWNQAFKLYQGFDEALGIADLAAAIDFVRGQADCTGKVGCAGFCLGGMLAYVTAARTDVDCGVGYYGVGIEGALDEAANISKPLMLHIAGNDSYCAAEAQARIAQGLGGHPQVTLHSYAGMEHAFARIGGEHFDTQAAARADGRTLEFLNAHLT